MRIRTENPLPKLPSSSLFYLERARKRFRLRRGGNMAASVLGMALLLVLLVPGMCFPTMGAPLPAVKVRFGANAAEPMTRGRVIIQAEFPWGATIPPSLTVYYEVDTGASTAVAGSDYQPFSGVIVLMPEFHWAAVIDVVPIDDGIVEGPEQIVFRLQENPNYTLHGWWPGGIVHLGDDEQPPLPPSEWFVATTGNDSDPGTLAQPFRTVVKAMTVARYGDTIYIRGGDYRDEVSMHASGVSFPTSPVLETSVGSWDSMLTIRNYGVEEVFMKGSEEVRGWQPTTSPDPQMGLWQVPWTIRSQQVFVDGELLGHVGWNAPMNVYPTGDPTYNAAALSTLANAAGVDVLQQNTAHMTNWSFFHDLEANVLYLGLPAGVDPNTSLVEASSKMPFFVTYDYIRVKGLKFRHSNLLAINGGWPAVCLNNYGSFEDCEIQWCDFAGLSVRDSCRISNCLIANNGMIGASAVGTNNLVSGNQFLNNHYLPFDFRLENAGAKNIGDPRYLDGCVWENNEIAGNRGPGLWFDSMTVRDSNNPVIVRNNYIYNNGSDGLVFEAMNGVRVYNNVSVGNKARALYLSGTTYGWVFNNTLVASLGSYDALEVNGGVGLLPHDLWIMNNIIYTDESVFAPDDPEVVAVTVIGQCTGATNIYFDYNYYFVRGTRPEQDYFAIGNRDAFAGPPPPGCTVGEAVYRTGWAGWQAIGNEPHGLFVTDNAIIDRVFLNEAAGDYRIAADSPVARAGANLYSFLQVDRTGRARPVTDNFSMGAYEFMDTLYLTTPDPGAREVDLDPGAFTITRECLDLSQALTVTYVVNGSATAGADYTTLSGTLIIPAQSATATLDVVPLTDALSESDETVTITLNPTPSCTVALDYGSGTVTIEDEPMVTIAALDAVAAEAGNNTGIFEISRQGPVPASLIIYYTVNGTATAGSDYVALAGSLEILPGQSSAYITVTPLNDTASEGTETVVVTLSENPAYTLGPSSDGTVNILDAPTVSVSAGGDAAEPASPGTFTITRDAAVGSPLTVSYTISGTATPGSDYTGLSGSATIPVNSLSVIVNVAPNDDLLFEGTETVALTLTPQAAYNIAAGAATLNLRDNEQRITIIATDPTATEIGGNTGTFTVSREGPTSSALTVLYAVAGTANKTNDYVALSGSVTIQASQLSAAITVMPVNDSLAENTETVVITLTANPAYVVGSPQSATVNIQNTPAVAVNVGNKAGEPSNPGTFRITRHLAIPSALTVFYTVTGTATAGSDYTALSSSAIIPANATVVTVAVVPVDDSIGEATETVILTIQPHASYNASAAPAIMNLTDNDPPAVPTGLVATPGAKRVDLTWNTSGGATSYKIRRATASTGPFSVIATTSSTNYRNSGLDNGTTYYYQVSAANSFGASAYSNVVSATPRR